MSVLKYYDGTAWVPLVIGSQGPPGQVSGADAPLYYSPATGKISIAQGELSINVGQVGGAVKLTGGNTISGYQNFTDNISVAGSAAFNNFSGTNLSLSSISVSGYQFSAGDGYFTVQAPATFSNQVTFSGAVSGITSTQITVTSAPSESTDVTNKAYVDNAVNIASSGILSVTNTDGSITVNNADPKNPVLSLPSSVPARSYSSPTFTGTATFTGVTLVGLTIDGGTA